MSFYTDFRFPSCCSNLQLPGDGSTGGFHVQSLQARWECSKSTDQCDATALQHLQGAWEVMGWNLWKLENLDKRIKKENFHGCKFQCKINAWNRTWNTWNGPCFFFSALEFHHGNCKCAQTKNCEDLLEMWLGAVNVILIHLETSPFVKFWCPFFQINAINAVLKISSAKRCRFLRS